MGNIDPECKVQQDNTLNISSVKVRYNLSAGVQFERQIKILFLVYTVIVVIGAFCHLNKEDRYS